MYINEVLISPYKLVLSNRIKVGRRELSIIVLQFVDDTLFLCKETIQNVMVLKRMLRCFELAPLFTIWPEIFPIMGTQVSSINSAHGYTIYFIPCIFQSKINPSLLHYLRMCSTFTIDYVFEV